MNWAAVGVNKPTVLLHLAFGLNQMIPVGMLLTQSNSSERKALKQLLEYDRLLMFGHHFHPVRRRGRVGSQSDPFWPRTVPSVPRCN
jgi:hypothetical protein